MRGAMALMLLAAAATAAGFLGLYEELGITSGDVKEGVGAGVDKGTSAWSRLVSEPWGYTAIGAGIAATLGIMTWRRIGGWGRGAVIMLAGLALGMIFLGR